MPMKDVFVSIIIPAYNEQDFIGGSIESILRQDYPKNLIEIFVVDGNSTDDTSSIVNNYSKNHANIKLIANPNRIVPYALNIGLKSSKGDVIIRIDAHSKYPSNYVSSLVKHLYDLNADNVGGVWNTLPGNGTIKAKAIAIAASHPFGIGNSLHKIGASCIVKTDTVPYGCYRRDVFDRIGLFDEDLVRNQDDEFNGRLIKNGGKIYLIPDVIIDYYARTTFAKTAKMFYQYGVFKPLVNKKLGSPATVRQFFPVLFLAGLILGLVFVLFSKVFLIIYLIVLSLYLLLAVNFSFMAVIKYKKPLLLLLVPFTFFLIHISYGLGYLIGIFKFLLLGAKSSSVNPSR